MAEIPTMAVDFFSFQNWHSDSKNICNLKIIKSLYPKYRNIERQVV